jgi:hypothetical protein
MRHDIVHFAGNAGAFFEHDLPGLASSDRSALLDQRPPSRRPVL